jgi:E3 ubiquitin-protein ligase ATL6/9/15/31/42/55
MGGAMSTATAATAVAATAAASASASVAAAQSPEPRNNPSLADVLSISVFMAVFFPLFVVLLAFACLHLFLPRDDRRAAPDDDDDSVSASELSRRGAGRKDGLDAAAIAALPLVFYREVRRHRIVDGREDALECSVCLLEFDDDDTLRLLPTCPHAFHPDCIALWLERHPTCPLCRASVLDEPPAPAQRELELQPVPPLPLQSPEASSVHATVVLIGSGASAEDEEEGEDHDDEEEADWTTIQRLARNRRAAGRQALPRSNSTGHGGGASDGGMERFALRLPEHVRVEILMSHRLRHVTSAVASVRVREGSAAGAHDGSTVGGSVRNAVARLMSLFVPGAGWKADGDDRSGRGDATGVSSFRRRENSSRGAVAEEKRSV